MTCFQNVSAIYFSHDLSILKLQGNSFHGNIPQTLMKGSNLMLIDLSNDSLLQGRIPQSLAKGYFFCLVGKCSRIRGSPIEIQQILGRNKGIETGSEFSKLYIIGS